MTTLEAASLQPIERDVLGRLVEALRARYRERLHAVWLYGSRARGEPPGEDSDIDLIVLLDDPTLQDEREVIALAFDASSASGYSPAYLSLLVERAAWPAERRAIRDFFIADVDRDRIVLYES